MIKWIIEKLGGVAYSEHQSVVAAVLNDSYWRGRADQKEWDSRDSLQTHWSNRHRPATDGEKILFTEQALRLNEIKEKWEMGNGKSANLPWYFG